MRTTHSLCASLNAHDAFAVRLPPHLFTLRLFQITYPDCRTCGHCVRNPNRAARRLPRCEEVVVAFSARPPTRTDRPDAQDVRGETTA
jgi:hypothetical protein